METKVTSSQFSLSKNDWLKGLLIAVGSPVFTIIIQSINDGSFTFNWKAIATTALSAFLMYISKNFFDKPKVIVSDGADFANKIKQGEIKLEATTK